MTQYQHPNDLKTIHNLIKLAPEEAQSFLAFNASIEREDGIIPPKYRELIAIAVALTTQCSYCIDVHTKNAKR